MSGSLSPLAGISPERRRLLLRRLGIRPGAAVRGAAIPRAPRDGDLPLSFAQQRLWLLHQLEPQSPAYNVPFAVRFEGDLSPALTAWAMSEIGRRHEALRTTFGTADGEPRQVIGTAAPVAAPVVELSALPAAARERESARLAVAEGRWPFDVERGPLLRVLLLRQGAAEHLALLTMHHLVSDGWSMGLLVEEFCSLYAAGAAGRPSDLPELAIQYADYACWQRRQLADGAFAPGLEYWRQRLQGAPPALALPSDRPRPAARGGQGAVARLTLAPETTAALAAAARRSGASLFAGLCAAFGALLARCGGDDDVVFGTVVANRGRAEIERLIGFFVNTLVLRLDLSGEPSFRELLERVRETVLDAQAHEEVPFDQLVEELAPERSLGVQPLVQALLVLQSAPPGKLAVPGLRLTPVEGAGAAGAKFDLLLTLREAPDGGLGARLEYATDLFDGTSAQRLLQHLATLLAAAAADPEVRLGELPLLTPGERSQVLVEWNDTAGGATERCLHELVGEQAERSPEAVAVEFEGASLTYRELWEHAGALASHLRSLGLAPEDPVGVFAERSLALPVALLAVLRAGGAYVPLDPAYPPERLSWTVEDAGMPVVLCQERLISDLPPVQARKVVIETAAEGWSEADLPPVLADQLAYVIYTSGSTGRPKGVMSRHRGIVNRLLWGQEAYPLRPGEGVLQKTPASFDVSVCELFSPLIAGARLVMARPGGHQDPRYLADVIAAAGVTRVHFVPSMLGAFVESGEANRCRGLERVIASGEALSPELVDRWHGLGLAAELHNLYGPTEASVEVTSWRCAAGEASVPIGRPVCNTRLHVVDRWFQPVPAGVAGELCIGGVQVARGYLGRPELTAEQFVPSPFAEEAGARLYRTGDIARWRADGAIEWLARLDRQIKLRGFRIELGEIEAALTRHPSIRECAVVVREQRGGPRLAAYVVPAGEAQPAAGEIQAFLGEKLPEHMVPASIVPIAALPLNPSGKVDRRALAASELVREPEARWIAPRTPVEEALAAMWSDLLGVERVGAGDSFFDLGGHSLLAMRVVSRVRDAFGVELSVRTVFEAPTLAALAARVAAARQSGDAAPMPAPIPRSGELPLSFAQERLWFLHQLEPQSPVYNIPFGVRFEGDLAPALTAWALTEIVRRHEALRTTFLARDGEPRQIVAEASPVALPQVDLSGLPEGAGERESARLSVAETRRPFDIERGPLLRALLLRRGASEHLALLTLHHLVGDGWSVGLLVEEFCALYAAGVEGRPAALPELAIQYGDYAVWQRRQLSGRALAAGLEYWRQRLAGAPPALALPSDRPRPAARDGLGAVARLALAPETGGALAAAARRAGASLFAGLCAGFGALLARCSGDDDIVFGTVVANRGRMEIERLIGFFANTLVLRLDLSGAPSFRELLGRARETVLGAQDHQEVPFDRLVEELSPARSVALQPLVQALLVLQGAPAGTLAVPGLRLTPVETAGGTAKFDLLLALHEAPDGGLGARLEYATDLFDASTASRLLQHLATLLATAVADPELTLEELPLLTPWERSQVLMEWNDTAGAGTGRCLHELIGEQAERGPEAVAVEFEGASLAYRELWERAGALASHLRSLGVAAEDRVGVFAERSLALPVALLAVLRAGGAYVPLDPAYPSERLSWMVTDSGMPILLCQEHLVANLPPHRSRLVVLERAVEGEGGEDLPPVSPDQLAYIIYTSGSTGRPKGVMNSHRGIVNRLLWMQETYDLQPGEGVLQKTPASFDVSVWELFWPLLAGARLVMARPGGHQDPRYLVDAVEAARVTTVHFVPSMLRAFVESGEAGRCRSLRRVIASGEALAPDLAESWHALGLPATLYNLYGPTEAAVDVTSWRCVAGEGAVPIGRPVSNTRMQVLDRWFQPAPAGVAGELCIGGVQVARGYLGRPELTAERFVPSPFAEEAGSRLYRTGDLARWRVDGAIEWLGRLDRQVKLRGFRIELEEIEATLGRHASVRECAVALREQRGGPRLVAYVVPAGEAPPAAGELQGFLRQRLPDHMVPSAVIFLPALPLNPSGKVDRRALPAGKELSSDREGGRIAPRTPTEEVLAAIWSDLLGVEQVFAGDSFFELGGHSLLATRVVSRVRDAFGVELPVRALFEAPALAELAARIAAGRDAGAGAPALQPIAAIVRGGEQPLSFAQERLWFLDRLQPDLSQYNISYAAVVEGKLTRAVLGRCLGEVMRRHEILGARFLAGETGEARQVIDPAPEAGAFPLPLVDLETLPAEAAQRQARRLAREEARRPFDLGRGPLLRAMLLRTGREAHVLLVTVHHIVADAWSLGLLVEEVRHLYTSFVEGRPAAGLAELPIQYVDFVGWQRRTSSGPRLAAQLAWWREQLAGIPAVLDLPADRPRPRVQSFRGASAALAPPSGLAASLAGIARRQTATPFMVLLTAFQALLHHYTGRLRFCIGTPVANRTRSEIESLIGLFVNTLVLPADLTGDPTFGELLVRTRQLALGAYEHQELPFERLVEDLAPARDLGRTPLVQVVLVLQNAPARVVELPGLTLRPLPGEGGTAKFDLTLTLVENGGALAGRFEYATDLFDAATVGRWAGHFVTLLGAAAAGPDLRLSELPAMGEAERHQLLREWNGPLAEFAAADCLHELFAAWARRRPLAVAAVCGEQRLSYGELESRANRLARHLLRLGVGPESLVGIFLERSLETVVAILGVLKAGGAYLPLDPAHPAERLAWMLTDAGARVLVTGGGLYESSGLGPALAHLAAPPEVVRLDADGPNIAALAAEEESAPATGVSPANLAYVIYTSGSTGRPKGVQVEHRQVARLLTATAGWFGFGEQDVWTLFHSYAFDFSVWELWGALANGARLVVVPYWVSRSPEQFYDLLCRERVTVLNQTPGAFRALQRAAEERAWAGDPALRWVIFGGEALEPRSLAPWFGRHGERRPRLVNMYGITETTVHVTWRPLSAWEAAGEAAGGSRVGVPIPDLQVYLLDGGGQPVPLGVPGEIHVGGAGVARGYLGRPALTAERFLPDPFSGRAGARLYRSGDLARYRSAADLEYLGRTDQQVKVRGFRIELGEIEVALAAHPQVREAVVLARQDGEQEEPSERRLVAYVVARDQGPEAPALDLSELRAFARGRLPEYLVPAVFVPLPALPLTTNGKIDRAALPAPGRERPDLGVGAAAPRGPAEELLAGIWADVLRLERVGVHDNFFDLGGDSILSLQIVARARLRGLLIEPRHLFEHQTIAELAAVAVPGEGAPAEQGLVTGPLPLSPIQHWFLAAERADPHHSNQSVLLASRQPLRRAELAPLARVAARLLAHHDALRLRLARGAGGWKQHMAGLDGPLPFHAVDLEALPAAARAAAVESCAAATQSSLDLAAGPLVRFVVFLRGEGEPGRLLVVVHHWAIDGVSWRILLEDLVSAWAQAGRGEDIVLPPKTSSYRDWTLRLAEYAGDGGLEGELAYWREVARGVDQARRLLAAGRARGTGAAARTVTLELTAAETTALLREVPEVYRTRIDEVLLAALARAAAVRSGGRGLLVDLEGHGREDVGGELDLSRTVGWFTAIYPVWLELADPSDPGACLRATKEQLRRVPQRGVGYGLLRYLRAAAAAELAALPRPEIAFNYLGQLDQALPADAPFAPAPESRGPEQSPHTRRPYRLEIGASIAGGVFRTTWTYDSACLAREEVEPLAEAFLAALSETIEHCRSRQAIDYAPADFPDLDLSEELLARALAEVDESNQDHASVSETA